MLKTAKKAQHGDSLYQRATSAASRLIAHADGAVTAGPAGAEAYAPLGLGAETPAEVRRFDSPDAQVLAQRSPGVQSGGSGSLWRLRGNFSA